MNADVLKLYEYLNQDKIDRVPVYQRNYSWTKENCEQFFTDIKTAGKTETIKLHFIGSIIIIVEGGLNGNINTIIDGQQRLTTSFLFLKAFYDVTTNTYYKDEFIKRRLFKITEEGMIKKLDLNRNDNEVLKKLLNNNDLTSTNKNSKIFKNYQYFIQKIQNEDDEKVLIDGFKKLRVVGIQLDSSENPQLIFESLNSTGLKLSATDLIRNFLLMAKKPTEQTKLYSDYWYKIENIITNDNMVEFFRRYLIIKTQSVVTDKKVYEKFKEYIVNNEIKNIEGELQTILFYAKVYAKLIFINLEDDIEIKSQLLNIEILNQKVIYPFILESYVKYETDTLNKNDFLDILNFIENYLTRSLVCDGAISKGLNRFNAVLIKGLNSSDNKVDKIKNILITTPSKNKIKSNNEFIIALKHSPIYENKTLKGGKILLFKIEKGLNPKEVVENKNISVEHIMPQTLTKEWKAYLGNNYKNIFSEKRHTLGNLTLTGYNSELSNKIYDDKKDDRNFKKKKIDYTTSNFSLNRYFNDADVWNQEAIEKRADELIETLLEIYPLPNDFIQEKQIKLNSFSLSERNEVKTINTTPKAIDLFDINHLVKSWRDIYTKTVEITYDRYQEVFDKHIELNSFNAKKNLLSVNQEDMKKLSNHQIGTFYLNVNLSSTQTLSNLSTIFQILNINEDDLTIYLKD